MLTAHKALSFIQNRHNHLVNSEIIKAYRSCNDIYDGVYRSHLMKMYLFHWYLMSLGFRCCQNLKNLSGYVSGTFCNLRNTNDIHDLDQPSVLMFFVLMRFAMLSMEIFHIMIVILMRLVKNHIKITNIQSRFFHSADFNLKSLHRKTLQSFTQYFLISSKIQQGSHSHITADSRITFPVQCITHSFLPFLPILLTLYHNYT